MNKPHSKGPRVNHQIRVPEVRVIEDGKMVGVLNTSVAIKMAQEKGADLIELDGNAKPPVCKIMELGKFKYEQKKKEQAQKQHQVETKELRLRPNTEEHDLNVKLKQARRFLEEGDKVKFTMMFQGREFAYRKAGEEVLQKLISQLGELAKVEAPVKFEGKNIFTIIGPNKK